MSSLGPVAQSSGAGTGEGEGEQVISVADFDRRLKHAVEGLVSADWIQGEISNLRRAASGHVYFTLRDDREDAAIDCVMFRAAAQRARRQLVDGALVQVRGRPSFWAPRARLQFSVDRLRAAGRGALLEALERLREKLRAEGLFDAERKRPLPEDPHVIGVVTSAHGAAFQDICTVAHRRAGVRIVLAPALVQGDGAAASLCAAIERLDRLPGLDVMIVGRGGGSGDDLMAFNDESLVRCLAGVGVPVVSAVGHDIDVTLADLVADVRAATPSQAAELVVPDRRAQRRALEELARRASQAVNARMRDDAATLGALRSRLGDPRFLLAERQLLVDDHRSRLELGVRRSVGQRRGRAVTLEGRLASRHPRVIVAEAKARNGPLVARLRGAVAGRLAAARGALATRSAELHSLSPLAVLGRGYAIVTSGDDRALRDASDVARGEEVRIRLSRGVLSATVDASLPVEPSPRSRSGR